MGGPGGQRGQKAKTFLPLKPLLVSWIWASPSGRGLEGRQRALCLDTPGMQEASFPGDQRTRQQAAEVRGGKREPFPQSLRAVCSKTPPHGSSMSWIPSGSNLPSSRVCCVVVGQSCGQWAGADGGTRLDGAGMEPLSS